MKLKNLFPAFMLLVAAITAFAFRPIENKHASMLTCVTYQYIGPIPASLADAHNPNNWQLVVGTPPACDGEGQPCTICVDASEIYPSNDPTYPNLPKVNVSTTDAYKVIEDAYDTSDPDNPVWRDKVHGTATFDAILI